MRSSSVLDMCITKLTTDQILTSCYMDFVPEHCIDLSIIGQSTWQKSKIIVLFFMSIFVDMSRGQLLGFMVKKINITF